jgi:hypothetical protein
LTRNGKKTIITISVTGHSLKAALCTLEVIAFSIGGGKVR